ncbi:helix-turn-helix domain-containing protein [uncultured Winogradskyella sp.]|uniref:helix-turn-helix domain-containing protein n=1 Tax=uncultured Winogradskyella sp. TaxID=395353 RepID=UPI00261A03BB|nr:helix-turn-helix domain-containing protein [uncultured Winogradskyella sp.]
MAFLRRIVIFVVLFLFFNESNATVYGKPYNNFKIEELSNKELDSILEYQKAKDSLKRENLIKINESLLSKNTIDSVSVNKTLAILYSENNNAEKASKHIKKYIKYTQDLSILNDHVFSDIKKEASYSDLINEYKPQFNFLAIIHALTGIIGIFMVIVLFGKKNLDRTSVMLIGLFVLFHSVFMLHISLFVSNYNLKFPHSFYISTPFSFLYGPLLYFYFKRVVQNYRLSFKDSVHLIPTLILIIWLIPFYTLSGTEKFYLQMDNTQSVLIGTKVIVLLKALSLCLYAAGIYIVYKNKTDNRKLENSEVKSRALWERSIMIIFVCYALAYILHGAVVVRFVEYTPFTYLKAIFMIAMIFYIALMSGLRPEIIMNANGNSNSSNKLPIKYQKSNLTPSLSKELKERLMGMLTNDKVYKNNDISLELLSETLGTTRHNTSQVINEHFDMSFYDLVNYFRIMEAVDIFDKDQKRNLNIIEVAYEVGYNNKVTFNKAFKKHMNQTPSSYLRSMRFA